MSENGYLEAAREADAERHRERARDRDRRERHSEREYREHRSDRGDREKDRHNDRDRRDRERDRERDRGDRNRDRDRYRERDRDDRRDRDRRDRDKDRDRPDRERERERRDRDRERDRHSRIDALDEDRHDRGRGSPRRAVNLDAVVPITERQRRMTMWDIKPKGYENITSEQAKLSGLFPLPGAPRQMNDAARLQALAQGAEDGENPLLKQLAISENLRPSHSRQSKRALVSNLPHIDNERAFVNFMNDLISSIDRDQTEGSTEDPIAVWQFSSDKRSVLLEFGMTEDATIAIAFSGVEFGGYKLKINRPKDYVVPEKMQDTSAYVAGSISPSVPDSPDKISISNIPVYLTEDQILELLKEFGELNGFKLLKDKSTGESKGIAFCEYVDEQITEIACEGLNGMELGDSVLVVRRACIGIQQAVSTGLSSVSSMAELANSTSAHGTTRILQLLNMIVPEDLNDDDEYEDIRADVREECEKFGKIVDLKIPRPTASNKAPLGVGKIFVRFEEEEACTAALKSLAGRKFADRTVVTTFFPEENYEVEAF
ncbi:hypothetical protein POJ06DRAFT_297029 [Lipomyces tetrasporus]|uniref:Splicing factor U2AF subunit n=1 Tax=Lipomyces tetrasporus TaxID=54092 RepID=A0AAD7QM88_9ASCO|nr:uncharacterized protein POJ06DRAFT_297029 [Lipomyces tetrasporus]KAJ8097834.1 hypothetical protein POJ06DRAFT_297029 [Lipomyces tetrasporus]